MESKDQYFCVFVVLVILAVLLPYMSTFSGGLSNESNNWGDFGSYLAGTFTIPISVVTLFYAYRTYSTTRETLLRTNNENELNRYNDALKEASSYVDLYLQNTIKLNGSLHSFHDLHSSTSLYETFATVVKNDRNLEVGYRTSVGKPILCLYDFLRATESKFGVTPTVRLYKIKYQWIVNIHNHFELDLICGPSYSSKTIHDFFYEY